MIWESIIMKNKINQIKALLAKSIKNNSPVKNEINSMTYYEFVRIKKEEGKIEAYNEVLKILEN